MQISSHQYFGTNRRTTSGGRSAHMHDLSSGYYYEHPQQYVTEFSHFAFDFCMFLDVIIIDIVIQLIIINIKIQHDQPIKQANVVVQQQQQLNVNKRKP
jgi:hypothetical protein